MKEEAEIDHLKDDNELSDEEINELRNFPSAKVPIVGALDI